MAETIGAKLRAARQARGLSVEDAAHETRIHANNIRGLENDDYSGFANITYAKSFLSLYSRFLGVDAADALAQFSTGDVTSARAGRTFLQPVAERIVTGPRPSMFETRPAEITSPGGTPVLLGLVLLLLLIAIPTLWYLGKDADSPEEVTTRLKELTTAVLDENQPAAAGEPIEQTPSASSPIESNALAVRSEPEPSSPQPELRKETVFPKESGPLQAKPISPATASAESDVSPNENGADQTSPPEPAAGESGSSAPLPGAQTKKPRNPAPETEPSAPAETQPAVPIRATPLIARPMVIPAPAAEQNPDSGDDSPADRPDDEAPRNRYPRPE